MEPLSQQHLRLLSDAPTSRIGTSGSHTSASSNSRPASARLGPAALQTPIAGPPPLAPPPPRAPNGPLRPPASLSPRPARPRRPAYRSERRLALGGGSQRPATARGPGRWGATSPTFSLQKTEQRTGRGRSRGRGREGREGGGGRALEGESEGGSRGSAPSFPVLLPPQRPSLARLSLPAVGG